MFQIQNKSAVDQTVHFGERTVKVGAGGLSAPLPDHYRAFFDSISWAELVIVEESIGSIEVEPPATKPKRRKKRGTK